MVKTGLTISTLLAYLAISLGSPSAMAKPSEDSTMQKPAWNTYYYGRFKLDLLTDSDNAAYYKIYNEKIDLISNNGELHISSAVDELTRQLKLGKARGTYSRYEKTLSLDNGSMLVISRLEQLYTLNSFLLTDKHSVYRMTVSAVNKADLEGAIEKMKLISNAIHHRTPEDAPPAGHLPSKQVT